MDFLGMYFGDPLLILLGLVAVIFVGWTLFTLLYVKKALTKKQVILVVSVLSVVGIPLGYYLWSNAYAVIGPTVFFGSIAMLCSSFIMSLVLGRRAAAAPVKSMSKDDHYEPGGRVTLRSLVPSVITGVLSFLVVLYLRIAPNWDSGSSASPVAMALPVVLMWIFYASILVALANFREMQGTVSGWFDVLGLMVAEGILVYLVFANLIYVSLVIALCCLFVAYMNFAQSD